MNNNIISIDNLFVFNFIYMILFIYMIEKFPNFFKNKASMEKILFYLLFS